MKRSPRTKTPKEAKPGNQEREREDHAGSYPSPTIDQSWRQATEKIRADISE